MPFTVEGEAALTETYKIRLSPGDKKKIHEQAEAAGMSMAKFMRFRALGYVVTPKSDLTTLNELRRIGGLLKYALSQLPSQEHAEVFQTMAALRDYAKELRRDREKDSKSE
jgi:hypothetical protein